MTNFRRDAAPGLVLPPIVIEQVPYYDRRPRHALLPAQATVRGLLAAGDSGSTLTYGGWRDRSRFRVWRRSERESDRTPISRGDRKNGAADHRGIRQ